MSHKTNDQPPSVYDLFIQHSVCRVIGGSYAQRLDALKRHARKYAHNR